MCQKKLWLKIDLCQFVLHEFDSSLPVCLVSLGKERAEIVFLRRYYVDETRPRVLLVRTICKHTETSCHNEVFNGFYQGMIKNLTGNL